MNNASSLLRIVNGLSKTLNIANQMIPLYKQVKPLISNSTKIINGIKNFNAQNIKSINSKTSNSNIQKTPVPIITNINAPTFFQ